MRSDSGNRAVGQTRFLDDHVGQSSEGRRPEAHTGDEPGHGWQYWLLDGLTSIPALGGMREPLRLAVPRALSSPIPPHQCDEALFAVADDFEFGSEKASIADPF